MFILTGGSESGGGGGGEGGDTEGDRNGGMRERKERKRRDGEEKLEVFQARTFLHLQKQSSSETVCKESPAHV